MFEEWGPGPFDSFDAYETGLRAPRCNGCDYARLKHELGDKFLSLNEGGWVAVYELGAEPAPGQGEPQEHEGKPIRHKSSFMSVGHSDECYGWRPPTSRPGPKGEKKREWLSPIEKVKLNLSRALRSEGFGSLWGKARQLLRRKRRPVTAWRTLDGQIVLLTEMTHRHLVNAYRMVEASRVKHALLALGTYQVDETSAVSRASLMLWKEIVRRGLRRRGKAWVDGDGLPVVGRVRMGMVRRGNAERRGAEVQETGPDSPPLQGKEKGPHQQRAA